MSKKDVSYGGGDSFPFPTSPHLDPISRVAEISPAMTVDQATEGDFRYFSEHPDQNEYIREFCPGEFGASELPELPQGFRYATLISVTMRVAGEPVGRFRQLMAVCDGASDDVGADEQEDR